MKTSLTVTLAKLDKHVRVFILLKIMIFAGKKERKEGREGGRKEGEKEKRKEKRKERKKPSN